MIKDSAIDSKLVNIDKRIEQLKSELRGYKPFDVKKFVSIIKKNSNQMKKSNGSKVNSELLKNYNKNIGIICDEFLWSNFKNTNKFIYLSPLECQRNDLDMVIIVSTWKGIDSKWRGIGSKGIKTTKAMFDMVSFYQAQNVPVVFFSKEDPTNYDRFIHIAQKCDIILTTCQEVIADYKRDCKHERVYLWGFSIDPVIHNPINLSRKKTNSILFSGSWYDKYPKRGENMRFLFDGVMKNNSDSFVIVDRNYNLKDKGYKFPAKYQNHIVPALSHSELGDLSRGFDYSININTVQFSQTMFATRVYENLATGLITLSNYSLGINNQFPTVKLFMNEKDVIGFLKNVTEDEKREIRIDGIRDVMSSYTNIHRLSELNELVFGEKIQCDPDVLLILPNEIDPSQIKQKYKNLTIKSEKKITQNDIECNHISMYYNQEIDRNQNYIADFANAFRYTNSDVIVKLSEVEFDYVNEPVEMFTEGNIAIWNNKATQVSTLTEAREFKEWVANKKIFSIQKRPKQVIKTPKKEYKLSVIVPVYNNGYLLKHKAFSSLKKSEIFDEMEIILIDDGSTDNQYTKSIARGLAEMYSNVKLFEYEDQGSGSASRPRNKGIELATCDYVTYLDPDNEACYPGHELLLNEIKEKNYEMSMGKMPRMSDGISVVNYIKYIREFNGKNIDFIIGQENIRKLLFSTNMRPHSIQAMVIKKSVIINNNLLMTPGAVGQDTMFCHELFCHLKSLSVLHENMHIYYAGVQGSAVNTINANFFKKYLLLETDRLLKYNDLEILQFYFDNRFEFYFENWYLKKLLLVKKDHVEESIQIILTIYNLYKDYGFISFKSDKLNKFIKYAEKEKYTKIMGMLK